MKTMYKLLSLYAILAFVSSCQPEDSNDTDDPNGPCAEFNSIAITGPTIAYLDSSFTLSAPSDGFISYSWYHESFTMTPVTGTTTITESFVDYQDAGEYTLHIEEPDCGQRTLTYNLEVRPKPFAASPCNTASGTTSINAFSTYTITNVQRNTADTDHYTLEASSSGGTWTIKMGRTTAPQFDQVWSIGTNANYRTIEVEFFRQGCRYHVENYEGKVYAKKVNGGTEYSMCGVDIQVDMACSPVNINTGAEFKFFMAD